MEPGANRCRYASSVQFAMSRPREETLAKCDQCGNDYDKTFQVSKDGRSFTFDSFECAIQKLAPTCAHCGCRIIGHGVEDSGTFYCCAHCAEQQGVKGLEDRV
jgi:hypothetical protein